MAEPIPVRDRFLAAAVGALLLAPTALTLDPFGIYRPEQHLGTLLAGALVGLGLGPLLLPVMRRDGWAGRLLAGLCLLGSAAVCHSSAIAALFSLAVDRRVLALGALLALVTASGLALRTRRLAEALLVGLVPLVLVTNVHHALFLRSPGLDCAEVARAPGVRALGTWPDPGDPRLADSLLYDVVGDEEAGLVFAAWIRQAEGAGCGALSVWGPDGTLRVEDAIFHAGTPDCRMTARLLLDPRRRVLWVPLSSYDPKVPPKLAGYFYAPPGELPLDLRPSPTEVGYRALTAPFPGDAAPPVPAVPDEAAPPTGGPQLSLGPDGPLVLDPSDLLLEGDRLRVLAYPRRFERNGASQLATIDVEDPKSPRILRTFPFEPNGWMTEYLASDGEGTLFVSDVFGHFYAVDAETLMPRLRVRPGASTLGIAVHGERLFVAAPYRRSVLELDAASLRITGERPAGNAMREVEVDAARGRLFATAYGDGELWAWTLHGELLGRLPVGAPLRGLDLLPGSGKVLVGGACGVFEVDPALAFDGRG